MNRSFRFLIWVSGALVLGALMLTLIGVFHGFDWSDEAWAYSLIQNNKVTTGEPWGFQYLLHPLFVLSGQSVLAFRFIRLILYIGLGLYAAWVMRDALKSMGWKVSGYSTAVLIICAQIGTILAWTWQPRSLAYNELAALGLQLLVIMQIQAFSQALKRDQPNVSPLISWIWAFSGLIVGVLFYGKFLASYAALLLTVLFPFFVKGISSLRNVLLGFLGVASGIVIPWVLGAPLTDYATSIWQVVFDEQIRAANSHSESLLGNYLNDAGQILLFVLPLVIMIWAIRFVSRKLEPIPEGGTSTAGKIVVSCLGALIAMICVFRIIDSGFGPKGTGAFALMLGALGISLIFAFGQQQAAESFVENKYSKRSSIYLLTVIMLVPFAAAFGTNNPLDFHLTYEATLWASAFGVGIIIVLELVTARLLRIILSLLLVSAVCIGTYLTVMSVRNPYRSASITRTDTFVTTNQHLLGISLLREESDWVTWMGQTARSFGLSHAPTLSLRSPGALYVFNNSSFASAWLDPATLASYSTLTKSCESEKPTGLVIIEPGTEMNEVALQQLKVTLREKCDLNFPGDFENIANFHSANTKLETAIWRQKP